MKAFESIPTPLKERSESKGIENGITMVIDEGIGYREAQDLVELAADYIDIIKIAFATARLYDNELLRRKVELYRKNGIDVMPGGTFFEIAVFQNKLDEFLNEAKNLGFSMIEISDGTIDMSDEERLEAINKVKDRGFKIIAEVGKKMRDRDLSGKEYAEGILRDIKSGVGLVIVEARASGRGIGIWDEKGNPREEKLNLIVENIDVRHLLFEAPNKNQQVYLIKRFGPTVNLGNIKPKEILAVESLRRGLRGDTFLMAYKQH